MGNKPTRFQQLNPELQAAWRDSNFTMEELLVWYQDFKKRHPTGQITMEEFIQIYQKMCPLEYDPSQFAKYVFRLYDSDGSGQLSFKEFICGLSLTSVQNPTARIDWIFKMYDIDKDGFITPAEMQEVLEAMFKMNPNPTLEYTRQLKLDLNELTPAAITEKIFAKYDTDQDKKLTKEEMLMGVQDDPYLSKLLS